MGAGHVMQDGGSVDLCDVMGRLTVSASVYRGQGEVDVQSGLGNILWNTDLKTKLQPNRTVTKMRITSAKTHFMQALCAALCVRVCMCVHSVSACVCARESVCVCV